MKNVDVKLESDKLIITVDLSKTFGPSKSGKTIIIASTEGNHRVTAPGYGDVTLGLNVYKGR